MLLIVGLWLGACEHLGLLRLGELDSSLVLQFIQIVYLSFSVIVASSVVVSELGFAALVSVTTRLVVAWLVVLLLGCFSGSGLILTEVLSFCFICDFLLLHHFVVSFGLLISILHEDTFLFHIEDLKSNASITDLALATLVGRHLLDVAEAVLSHG